MKFVFLNGPPGSGKDFAASALADHFRDRCSIKYERFSMPHKGAFAGMTKTSHRLDSRGNNSFWDGRKEAVIPELGFSYRQWQIDFSEKFMKPCYGEDIFARLLLDRCEVRLDELGWLCLVPDTGFMIELTTVAKRVGDPNCLLLRLHREGHDFSRDSRSYLDPFWCKTVDVENLSDPTFALDVCRVVEEWLGSPLD